MVRHTAGRELGNGYGYSGTSYKTVYDRERYLEKLLATINP